MVYPYDGILLSNKKEWTTWENLKCITLVKEARLKNLYAVDSVHPGKGKIMGKITDWSLPKDWGLGKVLTEIIRVFWGSDGTF